MQDDDDNGSVLGGLVDYSDDSGGDDEGTSFTSRKHSITSLPPSPILSTSTVTPLFPSAATAESPFFQVPPLFPSAASATSPPLFPSATVVAEAASLPLFPSASAVTEASKPSPVASASVPASQSTSSPTPFSVQPTTEEGGSPFVHTVVPSAGFPVHATRADTSECLGMERTLTPSDVGRPPTNSDRVANTLAGAGPERGSQTLSASTTVATAPSRPEPDTDNAQPAKRRKQLPFLVDSDLKLAIGVLLDQADSQGLPALYMASMRGESRIVQWLIAQGANLEEPDEEGHTPLFLACCNGHNRVVGLLLNEGASPHTQVRTGATPLHVACQKGQYLVAKLLLAHGAEPSVNSFLGGITPLMMAARFGHPGLVKALVQAGADVHSAFEGKTAIEYALDEGSTTHLVVAHYLAEVMGTAAPHVPPIASAWDNPANLAANNPDNDMTAEAQARMLDILEEAAARAEAPDD